MTETYSLDSLKILLETYIAPDRTPKTSTVARYNSITILEDVNWKALLLSSNLFLKVRCAINFAVLDVKVTDLLLVLVSVVAVSALSVWLPIKILNRYFLKK